MDIQYLADNMSATDTNEVRAYGDHSPLEAINYSISKSYISYIVYHDDKPVAVFGCANFDYEGNIGSPWMLSTGEFFKIPIQFFRKSREIVDGFLEVFDFLTVDVHSENEKSFQWLIYMGFQRINTVELNGEKFFTMRLTNANS